jgi:DNA-binding MarR family transcriptional regulator
MGRLELTDEIIRLQRQANQVIAQDTPEAWLDLSLTIAQLKSLLYIDSEGSANFRKLATALGVTPPDVTRIVDRLVEHKLVSRRENPQDRRMLMLQATKKGKALLSRLRDSRTARMNNILSRMSREELTTLAHGLGALVRAAEIQRKEDLRQVS